MSKVDVHHHFYPEAFTAALDQAGGDPSGWTVPAWTVEADMKLNRDIGVSTAIISVTAPGAEIEHEVSAQAQLARKCNIAGAALRDAQPANYGFFATLPSLLHTELALKEIAYALDELHADGVTLFTRYGEDNHYLGHEDFIPIWEELNHRKAVVFIHPTHAVDTNLINSHLPQPMFDYPHETGRTAMDLILSGRMNQVTETKIILSHAGGTLPYLLYRAVGMIPHTVFSVGKTTEELVELAKDFYFDVAIQGNLLTLGLLFQLARPGHVLFGSDFPNAPVEGIKYFTKNLDDFKMSDEQRTSVTYEAAWELFPRLRKA